MTVFPTVMTMFINLDYTPPKSTILISTPPNIITFELHFPKESSIASILPHFWGKSFVLLYLLLIILIFRLFFKQFQLLPPDCLPGSPVSIDSEYFIQIKIEALLVFFAVKVYLNNKLHHLADF